MIPKKKAPEVIKDLRPISITPFFSKLLESIVRPAILNSIEHTLQKEQFGGRPGSSVELHLAGLMHNLSVNMENPDIVTLAITVDFQAAFNSMQHNHIIESAHRLGVEDHVLRLLSSYLENRYTTVKWDDKISSERPARGGAGQGTLLSVILFIIAIDGLIEKLNQLIALNEEEGQYRSFVRVYCDDIIVVVTFEKKWLKRDNTGKLIFSDIGGKLSKYLKAIEDYSVLSGMKLNRKKTYGIVFDPSKKHRVHFPQGSVHFPGGEEIELCNSIKLIGFQISSNLSLE